MVALPNCKINLGLNVIDKRPDGFHNIETVFFPLSIKDALEIVPNYSDDNSVQFSFSGLIVGGQEKDNLCIKAYHLLKKAFPHIPPIKMHLHKCIPLGAGLGGGSADGAFTLQLLNSKFHLGLTQEQLIGYALQLGSDCPFFIINKPCFAGKRGEELLPVNLNLGGYKVLLVNPGIHINTGWAFSQVTPGKPLADIRTIINQPISTWRDSLVNDFELPVSKHHPELLAIKANLYEMGAVYASMSGSGSSFYGIFPGSYRIPSDIFSPLYYIKEAAVL